MQNLDREKVQLLIMPLLASDDYDIDGVLENLDAEYFWKLVEKASQSKLTEALIGVQVVGLGDALTELTLEDVIALNDAETALAYILLNPTAPELSKNKKKLGKISNDVKELEKLCQKLKSKSKSKPKSKKKAKTQLPKSKAKVVQPQLSSESNGKRQSAVLPPLVIKSQDKIQNPDTILDPKDILRLLLEPLIKPYVTSDDATQEDVQAYTDLDKFSAEVFTELAVKASQWVFKQNDIQDLPEDADEFLDFVDTIPNSIEFFTRKGLTGPLSVDVLVDPVRAADDTLYERYNITTEYIDVKVKEQKAEGKDEAKIEVISPFTKKPLSNLNLTDAPEVKQRILTLVELSHVISLENEQVALAYLVLNDHNDELFNRLLPCDYDVIQALADISDNVKQLLFHLKPSAQTILESPDLKKQVLATEDDKIIKRIEKTIEKSPDFNNTLMKEFNDAKITSRKKQVEYIDARGRGKNPKQAAFYVAPSFKTYRAYWATEKHSTLGKSKFLTALAMIFFSPSRVGWQKFRNKFVGRNQSTPFMKAVRQDNSLHQPQPVADASAVDDSQASPYKMKLFNHFLQAGYDINKFVSDVDPKDMRSRSNSLNSNPDSDVDVDDLSASLLSSNF